MDHPEPTNVIPLEPSRSTSETQIPLPLERQIGKAVALTASAIAEAVRDYASNGRMTVTTKVRTAGCFSELHTLRCLLVPVLDFDGVAHEYGRLALAEACSPANDTERAIIDTLINTVMDILRRIARAQTN